MSIEKVKHKVNETISDENVVQRGKWYWIVVKEDGEAKEELFCATKILSNAVEMTNCYNRHFRVLLKNFEGRLELDPEGHFRKLVDRSTKKANEIRGEIEALTKCLGVGNNEPVETSTALAVGNLSSSEAKAALVLAKGKTLPELFKALEKAHEKIGIYHKAALIPLRTESGLLQEFCERIDDRSLSIDLYAGLTETLHKIQDGAPAAMTDKVHLFQRMHFMDEEVISSYTAGGIFFETMDDFDAWLLKEENLKRILPFPRCIVAFRVRRESRPANRLLSFMETSTQDQLDKSTFLYIRNGQQVFWLQTSIDFGKKLFPSKEAFVHGRMYARMFGRSVERIISENQYRGLVEEHNRAVDKWRLKKKNYEEWEARRDRAKEEGVPFEEKSPEYHFMQPHMESYEEVSPENVMYDEMMAFVHKRAREQNRLALILQGLLDRSMAFYPHPVAKLWTEDGFERILELVFDEDRALAPEEMPDFEAFRKEKNKFIKVGSLMIGQQRMWRMEMAKEERARRGSGRDWLEEWAPYGNPGPGLVAKVTKVWKDGRVSFSWMRESNKGWKNYEVKDTFTCDIDDLFCVDDYKIGEYKQFYADPRSRARYMQWASTLLLAEECKLRMAKGEQVLPWKFSERNER